MYPVVPISTPRCCARGAVRTIWCRSNGNAQVSLDLWGLCHLYCTRCCRLVSVLIWGASILSLLGCTSNIYFFVVVGPYSKYVSSTIRRLPGARHMKVYYKRPVHIVHAKLQHLQRAVFIYVFQTVDNHCLVCPRLDNTRHVTSV